MTETKPKKRRREELGLKQKVFIGIAVSVLLIILLLKVIVPQYALLEGRRIRDRINATIRTDHFELIGAERAGLWGIQYFASFQSTTYDDLIISSDMSPRYYTGNSIRFLYDRAVEQKSMTIRRFDMATSDALLDALKPELGDKLLRVMGAFGPEAPEVLELDEAFQLGRLRSYVPTLDIEDTPTDENYLEYLEIILAELEEKDYGSVAVNIQFTPDRKQQTTYSLTQTDAPLTMEMARTLLESHRNSLQSPGFRISSGVYYDFPYNHDFTIPAS